MPKVPYSPIPDETAITGGPRGVSVNTGDAFGERSASALGDVGQALQGAGGEIFARAKAMQDLANDAEAKEADANFMIEAGKLHAEYGALEGKARVDAFKTYPNTLKEMRTKIASGLSNDAARKIYDRDTLNTMARTIFNAAGMAASANRQYVKGANAAVRSTNESYVMNNPDSDEAFEQALQKSEDTIRQDGALDGSSPEVIHNEVNKTRSSMIATRIEGMARNEPMKAKVLFDKEKKFLRDPDLKRAETTVKSQLYNQGARIIASKHTADIFDNPTEKPEKPLADRVEAARKEAEELYPEDKVFVEQVTNQVISIFDKHKKVLKDTEINNVLTVNSAIIGDFGGKLPTNQDELTAISPVVDAAWKALSPTKRRGLIPALTNNAKDDYIETEESFREYLALTSQATSKDVEERSKFVDMNVATLEMPKKRRSALNKLQEKAKSSAYEDPRVERAMARLLNNGIAPRRDQSVTRYNTFRGALQMALDEFAENNKGIRPDFKQIDEIGSRLLQEQLDPNKYTLGIFNRTTPLYQQAPPSEWVKNYKEDPRWAERGIKPTDEMAKNAYIRESYKKLYGDKVPQRLAPPVSR